MNAQTQAVLDRLKRIVGEDSLAYKELEREVNAKPEVDNQIGSSIMDRAEFTTYETLKEKEQKELEEKVQQLAALHDSKELLNDNPELLQETLETIVGLEQYLISEGYPEDEVKAVTFKHREGLENAVKVLQDGKETSGRSSTSSKEKEGGSEMADEKKYIDEETFRKGLGRMAVGGIAMNTQTTAQLLRHQQIFGDVPTPEKIEEFEKELLKGVENNENPAQVADRVFGFSTKLKEKEEASRKKEIEEAEARGEARAAQRMGIPQRQSKFFKNGQSPVFRGRDQRRSLVERVQEQTKNKTQTEEDDLPNQDQERFSRNDDGRTATINATGKKVPVNKWNDPELFRGLRTPDERVNGASEFLGELEEKNPELFQFIDY